MLWSHSGDAGALGGGSGLFCSFLGAPSAAALALVCCASLKGYFMQWAHACLNENACCTGPSHHFDTGALAGGSVLLHSCSLGGSVAYDARLHSACLMSYCVVGFAVVHKSCASAV